MKNAKKSVKSAITVDMANAQSVAHIGIVADVFSTHNVTAHGQAGIITCERG